MTQENGNSTPMFEMAAASVLGHEHFLVGKANQDSFATATSGEWMTAVVCDGCGSGEHSEVGAYLGARLVAKVVSKNLSCRNSGIEKDSTWDGIHQEVTHRLFESAYQVADFGGGNLRQLVEEAFLFTVVGVAIGPEHAVPFAIGDGVIYYNGERIPLGPFPNNAPPYIGYGMLRKNGGWSSESIAFQRFGTRPSSEFSSVLLGTDGVDDLGKAILPETLDQFWLNDKYFKNRDSMRRRLALLNRGGQQIDWEQRSVIKKPHLLPDDTTMIVIRRPLP